MNSLQTAMICVTAVAVTLVGVNAQRPATAPTQNVTVTVHVAAPPASTASTASTVQAEARQAGQAAGLDGLEHPIATDCPEPSQEWGEAQSKAYAHGWARCIADGYDDALKLGDVERPTVKFYDSAVKSACGRSTWFAFFCSADNSIYLKNEVFREWATEGELSKAWTFNLMAHEVTHWAQAQVKVDSLLGQTLRSPSDQTRRSELQAECLARQFSLYTPVAQGFAKYADQIGYGPDEAHGSAESHFLWRYKASTSKNTSVCNTLNAPEGEVR